MIEWVSCFFACFNCGYGFQDEFKLLLQVRAPLNFGVRCDVKRHGVGCEWHNAKCFFGGKVQVCNNFNFNFQSCDCHCLHLMYCQTIFQFVFFWFCFFFNFACSLITMID